MDLVCALFISTSMLCLSQACVEIPGLPTEIKVPEDTPVNTTIYLKDVLVPRPIVIVSFNPASGSTYFAYKLVNGSSIRVDINATLDYETNNNFTILFDVQQMQQKQEGKQSSCYIDVIVEDKPEAPAFPEDVYFIQVNEGVVVNEWTGILKYMAGTKLTMIKTGIVDPDQDDVINYSIHSLDSGKSPFSIDLQSGMLFYNTDYSIDGNANPEIIMANLVATDSTGLTDKAIVYATILNINDNAPIFPFPDVTVYLSSLTPLDTNIQNMIATDADGDSIKYILTGTEIVQNTFHVHMGQILLMNKLGTDQSMILYIIASDGQLESTATVTVRILECNSDATTTTLSSTTPTTASSTTTLASTTTTSSSTKTTSTTTTPTSASTTPTSASTAAKSAQTSNESSNDNSCTTSNASLSWIIPLVLFACTAVVIAFIVISRKVKKRKEEDGNKVKPIGGDVVPAVA